MKSDELLDLVEELGLNERQTIGTLLNEVESWEVANLEDDRDDLEDMDSAEDDEVD